MSFGQFAAIWNVDREGARADAVALTENGAPTLKGKGYQLDGDVVAAVDVALALGRPLLVSGEPGCGKTELGYAIARRLGIDRLYLHSVKSNSEAGELFYTYDALSRFRAAQLRETQDGVAKAALYDDVGDYVEFQALGRALIEAHESAAVAPLLRGKHRPDPEKPTAPPRRSVVVIDEIDKASKDFPNDLLHEIETMSFRVREFPGDPPPETPPGYALSPELRPVVLITSNEERQLPDAFLRRCIFHEINFPEGDILKRIIASGLTARLERMGLRGRPDRNLGDGSIADLVKLLLDFRGQDPDKKPGIAEMLDAAALLAVSKSTDLAVVRPALAKLKRDSRILDMLTKQA
ncbi:AAA family ATPase [Bosea caraganae]|uniref:AAA family ATPase n=1 Tax=Bosea caraganae TaxID=2763117 RepID=A0A370L5V7_9HYPH|nr:MoxR family ATPase [Bosea caraganae]RDJ23361.1 AAA family ATPase [Bosea caraganae]RDJ24527.1 AAA family ATPase [Bosea caraganae]